MRFWRYLCVSTVVVGAFFAIAGSALASTTHVAWRGWCGGPALTQSQLLVNLDRMGATGSASKFFGIQPLNENLAGRVHATFAVAILAQDATIQNEGCSGGALFSAGSKHLSKGTKVWIDMTSLRAKFPNGFSLTPKRGKGWKRVSVNVTFRAQTSCTNPGQGTVTVFVWVRVMPPAKHKKVTKQVSIKVTTIPCAGKLIQVGVNQFVCEVQTNNNSSSQSGSTSGQGSPVINVNQTTQVNVNQNQNQGQSQQQSSSPPATCPAGTTGTPPNCVTPPVSKPAPSCSFNTVQELDESNFSVSPQITSTAPVYLHCTAPSGDSLSITLRAGTGTLSSNSASYTATGSDQVTTVTYTAPTEPVTDTVSAHVVDNTTGESTDPTVSIKIVAPDSSP